MPYNTEKLIDEVRNLILISRKGISNGINVIQVKTYYKIGMLIVEYEQEGAERAKYGNELIIKMSKTLLDEFGKGFSERNLRNMRKFYLEWKGLIGDENGSLKNRQTVSAKSLTPLNENILSWSHYVFLMGISEKDERNFYEIESKMNDWSLRELKRQFDASLYERLALGRDKNTIMEMSLKGQIVDKPEDLFKEPLILEFLGLRNDRSYSEKEMETAIIDKLEQFLLELGKGFLFEARQRRFTFETDHFFVDLVFYNRILRCYVLLDLKIGKLTHQDLGQMQMYVNYFDRFLKLKGENPTIGIILCKEKNDAVVELTLPKDTNIYPSRYQLFLPSKKDLREKLLEWSEEMDVALIPEVRKKKKMTQRSR